MDADLNSIIVYFSALLITLLLGLIYNRIKIRGLQIIHLCIMALPFSLVAGFRYNVGTDYLNYLDKIQTIATWPLMRSLHSPYIDAEPFFVGLVKTLSYLCDDPRFLFSGITFVTVFVALCAFVRLKDKMNICLGILFYYLLLYHPSLNLIRQCLAISFVLLAVTYLIEEKYCSFLFVMCFAVLSHYSAVFCLSFLVFPVAFSFLWRKKLPVYERTAKYRKRRSLGYTIILISPLLLLAGINVILSIPILKRYTGFLNSEINFGVGTILLFILMYFPFAFLGNKTIGKDKQLFMMRDIILLYLPVSFLGYIAEIGSRLNMFTQSVMVLFIPMLIRKEKDRTNKLCIIVYYSAWFILSYVINILINNHGQTFPYQCWGGI